METDVKSILSECSFTFKKQFGQNFITDKNLLASIVSLSGAGAEDTVLEIGCGAGTLTRALCARVKRVIGYEVDKSLKPVLSRTLGDIKNVTVIYGDFLKADMGEVEREIGEYRIVANLPYYITTPLIMKIVEEGSGCASLTVMVQEEVARRLCASAGTPDYGAITAMIAPRADCRIVKKVSRDMFYPRPDVDSAVVRLDFNKKAEVTPTYKKVVRAAFSSRRKTLENNLVNGFSLTRERARKLLSEAGIDGKARGETLDYTAFCRLASALDGQTQ